LEGPCRTNFLSILREGSLLGDSELKF